MLLLLPQEQGRIQYTNFFINFHQQQLNEKKFNQISKFNWSINKNKKKKKSGRNL